MSYSRRNIWIWPWWVLLVAIGCASPPADNLLIVSFDTTRADRLSAYGYEHPTTPNVAALAEAGVLFENAYTHVPSTLPAHCSMLTGLLPPSHGVRSNGKFRLADEQQTLAEILLEQGFATAAIIAALPLDARFGMDQGFELYDGRFAVSAPPGDEGSLDAERWFGHRYEQFERPATQVTDRAIEWISRQDGRWFMLAHYFDPHAPYDPPAEWAQRFDSAYDAEIAFADHQLGRLLNTVRELPGRTLIVFTADHGEGLGDHGEAEHNRYLYNSTLRVPLVMALEGTVKPEARLHSPVGLVDLLPTALALLGIELPGQLEGRSLAEAMTTGVEPTDLPVYAETLVSLHESGQRRVLRSLIEGSFKVVRTDEMIDERPSVRDELYDLASDPAEQRNLAAPDPTRARQLADRLLALSEQLEANAPTPELYELDEDMLEALRSLGYMK